MGAPRSGMRNIRPVARQRGRYLARDARDARQQRAGYFLRYRSSAGCSVARLRAAIS